MKRVVLGDIGGGAFGLRVAKAGHDALIESFGSQNIGFDSRLTDFGIVHQSGIWNWGDPIVSFPTLPYIPICTINHVDTSGNILVDEVIQTTIGTAVHWTTPFVAIVTVSSLEIVALTNPYYSFSVPTAGHFFYQVFAIEA